ncbi:MAG: hypothetical protein OXG42_01820 [Chloroflexi bacterium]|nr:hypothetical protein [Chloroflexota bacterium]
MAASAFSLAKRNALRRAVRAAASAWVGPGAGLFQMAANCASALALSIFPTAISSGWLARLTSGSWLIPFIGACTLMHVGVAHDAWLAMLLAPFAALALVRIFVIQHDCGHVPFSSGAGPTS